MVTADELESRRAGIAESPDLSRLLERLEARAEPVLNALPLVPREKALLSVDGGVCPEDGSPLAFDPWSPNEHRCPRCHKTYTGPRHDGNWTRLQHLWLAERAAHLATLAAVAGNEAAADRSRQLLTEYGERYLTYPNQDNVLGPSRLFFSTYLESIWITNYLVAAFLIRDVGLLDSATESAVNQLAEEATAIIGEFDEGFSNRQTWNNAALLALGVWFEDEDLARRAIEGPTGLLAHLIHGFGGDGAWYEGENYHLFALRGLLVGAGWARLAGVDIAGEPSLAGRLGAALRAPALTALPDLTFPARKDARFGMSLAQPMYLELWEIGLEQLRRSGDEGDPAGLDGWLGALYRAPAPPAATFESYLHEAGEPAPSTRSRWDLSWWALLGMGGEPVSSSGDWTPDSALLENAGLAVLRAPDRYVALECGRSGGGHGHADRLNLMIHAAGRYLLPDYGTGSYTSRALFWYRSTLAHNAPQLDGKSQPWGHAVCEYFDATGDWKWVRGRFGELNRSVVTGPQYLLDVVEVSSREEHLLELPWHLSGSAGVKTPGQWEAAASNEEFLSEVERFRPSGEGPVVLDGGGGVRVHFVSGGALHRGRAPGAPGEEGLATVYVLRARGHNARLVSVVDFGGGVRLCRIAGDVIEVETGTGLHRHLPTVTGWRIESESGKVELAGGVAVQAPWEPLIDPVRPTRAHSTALWVDDPPVLDGTLAGFDLTSPLSLDIEDQYRRSEDPYAGADVFSAGAYANWNDTAFFLGVEVTKETVILRPPESAPLLLDNETDDIHSDGVEVFLAIPGSERVYGFLVVPSSEDESLRVRAVEGTSAHSQMVRGAWSRTESGYRVTMGVTIPEWADASEAIDFDLLINEMRPDRVRRAGQLVWSGGGGWVWLRGDRQGRSRFGVLDLRR